MAEDFRQEAPAALLVALELPNFLHDSVQPGQEGRVRPRRFGPRFVRRDCFLAGEIAADRLHFGGPLPVRGAIDHGCVR